MHLNQRRCDRAVFASVGAVVTDEALTSPSARSCGLARSPLTAVNAE